MSSSAVWSLSAVVLVVLTSGLISLNGSDGAVPPGGAVIGLSIALLWLSWRRSRLRTPRPISEYIAIGYFLAFYTVLAFTWNETGDRWQDWLLLVPPVAWIPPTLRTLAASLTGRRLTSRTMRRLHRLMAAVYALAVAFFVVSIIAVVVSPVPLVGALLHLAAARFYGRESLDGLDGQTAQ